MLLITVQDLLGGVEMVFDVMMRSGRNRQVGTPSVHQYTKLLTYTNIIIIYTVRISYVPNCL